MPVNSAIEFPQARNFLLANRCNYADAYQDFRWPALEPFNWATDYFDVMAANNAELALIIDSEDSTRQSLSFATLSGRVCQA
jgi:acetyl-CoA synthetase